MKMFLTAFFLTLMLVFPSFLSALNPSQTGSALVLAAKIAAGGFHPDPSGYGSHTCIITTGGGVKCWGRNTYGELGNGTMENSNVPVDVTGLSSGVREIGAGVSQSCAVTSAGAAKCWGNGNVGRLGNNDSDNQSTPVDVLTLASGTGNIAGGGIHTCAAMESGQAKCWGGSTTGQIGDGFNSHRYIPVDVTGVSDALSVKAGDSSSCALTTAGAVRCWGNNTVGALGDGTFVTSYTAVNVSGLSSGVQAIALGGPHACAITAQGGVKCWGQNAFGQLGNNSTTNSGTPVDVEGLSSGIQAIALGMYHSCALTISGGVKCWGHNIAGQLGDISMLDSHVPVNVITLTSGVKAIAAGGYHSCAILDSGAVKCWGLNSDGQLGDGANQTSPVPYRVSGIGPSDWPTRLKPARGKTLKAKAKKIKLSWRKPAGKKSKLIKSYTLQVSTDSGFATLFKAKSLKGTTYEVKKLSPATTYYWRVRAKYKKSQGETGIWGAWSSDNVSGTNLPVTFVTS